MMSAKHVGALVHLKFGTNFKMYGEKMFSMGRVLKPGQPQERSPIVQKTQHERAGKRRDKGQHPSV